MFVGNLSTPDSQSVVPDHCISRGSSSSFIFIVVNLIILGFMLSFELLFIPSLKNKKHLTRQLFIGLLPFDFRNIRRVNKPCYSR